MTKKATTWPDPALPLLQRQELLRQRNALVMQWYHLPEFVLKRMNRHPCLYGIDRDDVLQEMRRALIRAAELFDPSKGYQFNTYATRCLLSTVLDFRDSHLVISIPKRLRYNKATNRPDEIEAAQRIRVQTYSLGFVFADGYQYDLLDDEEHDLDAEIDIQALLDRVRRKIHPRLWRVLQLRFLKELTLEEAGKEMGGLTKERVRQLQKAALEAARGILMKKEEQ